MRRFTLIASLTLLGLSACSSDSSSSATTAAADTTEASVAETVVEETVVDETVVEETMVDETMVDDTEPSGSGDGDGDGTEFCDINTELNNDDLAMDGSDTPAEIEEYFTVIMPAQLARLEGVTPPELADDVAILIAGVTQFGDVLEANDWDLEAAFADPEFGELANNAEFAEAGQRVDEYCGV